MSVQSIESRASFVPKAYDMQTIKDILLRKSEIITIELETISDNKPISITATLTIAHLSGSIESDVTIPLNSHQLYDDALVLLFNIDDQRVPLNQRKELHRITNPIDLVGASTLDYTIDIGNGNQVARCYEFQNGWHKVS